MTDNGHHEHEQEQEVVETLVIKNEQNEDEIFQVLYRFEQDNGKKYILLISMQEEDADVEDEEQEVFAFRYEDKGEEISLIPIEDDGEWDMVEEVLHTLETELDNHES
ncbi:Protein of unknown function [Marininema mesophilum]|uniref:UPF0473 protein SAMN05444487_10545 n=1 Tax=Marininema mesophilum TaxID=1048340 RepID=A0A1H2VAY5_9BACL|nr:DUF1292 domain-containing protein [Marininema mesophilum]SDW65445.1 Protein of unknown function [Marininema mesophilum]